MTIFKYPLKQEYTTLYLPADCRFLTVGVQAERPVIWVELSQNGAPVKTFIIRQIMTGEKYSAEMDYIGTVQIDGIVSHYFKKGI